MACLTIAGYVGEGNRYSVYQTLRKLDVSSLVLRTSDPTLVDIARLVVRKGGGALASLPEEVELDHSEVVWVFGEAGCPKTHLRLKRFRQNGLACLHLVI